MYVSIFCYLYNMKATQINKEIKKEVINLMGKFNTNYSKKTTKDDEFYFESEIIISYESTCVIDKIVDYKIIATYNKYDNKISLIQL